MGQERTGTRRPIGVFDSGVGGLTVVRALRAVLPGEDIIYLGDTARVPYGSKSPRTVERYSLTCQRFLLDRDVKLVLIACNTASATALPALAAASPVPVIGAVEPGASRALAATRGNHIGVIGTLATVRSGAYVKAIAAQDSCAKVTAVACPLLVPLAEEGWTDDDIARLVARRYLAPLFAADPEIDTLVLGCTHYPLLREVLTRVARELAHHDIAVVDSATAMAEAAGELLAETELRPEHRAKPEAPDQRSEGSAASDVRGSRMKYGLLGSNANRRSRAGQLACFATDTSRLDELFPRFLGEPLTGFALVDL